MPTLQDRAAHEALDRKLERVRKLRLQSWRIVLVGYGPEVREARIEEAKEGETIKES